MPRVIFITPDGTEEEVEAEEDQSVMEAAIENGIEGIVAECGGAASCSTCHVYVDEQFAGKLDTKSDVEEEMLEGVAAELCSNSRLSCQIPMRSNLDGLRVTVAPEQQ